MNQYDCVFMTVIRILLSKMLTLKWCSKILRLLLPSLSSHIDSTKAPTKTSVGRVCGRDSYEYSQVYVCVLSTHNKTEASTLRNIFVKLS